MATAKGFKITDPERKTRVGIAVRSFGELKKKTIEKFKLPYSEEEVIFQTPDGTKVESDDYFQTLPAQTLLIWVKPGERAETDAEILYKTIREVNDEYLKAGEKVQEFFTEKMKTKVFKLAEVLKGIDTEKVKLSSRNDHPDWFEGLDTRAKSKEDYMFRRAQDRIRMYFYKTRSDLRNGGRLSTIELNALFKDLESKLKLNLHHGFMFDRRACTPAETSTNQETALCDSNGLFLCDGRWDKKKCLYGLQHSINPYSSREARIIFQTWNLDHQVERARSVVPAIRDALLQIQEGRAQCLDVKAIYNDLFTRKNLKFVHIVCHDKGAHITLKAGPYSIP